MDFLNYKLKQEDIIRFFVIHNLKKIILFLVIADSYLCDINSFDVICYWCSICLYNFLYLFVFLLCKI